MDYFKLVRNLAIPKEVATKVYRVCNGGYFTRLYYARPPMIAKLRYWPNGYTKKIIRDFPILARPKYNEAFEMLVFTDVFAILGMSSSISGESLSMSSIEREVDSIFLKIKEIAEEHGIPDYPIRTSVSTDASGLIPDLLQKRSKEREMNYLSILSDAIYDSDEMQKMKEKYPWARTLTRETSLKAISLSRDPEKLITLLNFLIVIVAGSVLTNEFDRLVMKHGIRDGLNFLIQEGHSALMNVEEGTDVFAESIRKLKEDVNSQINYF
ncbi:hypothetical protein [Sulfuracidifex tepidarius]|uniref:Uncharacterized protein n=2 Tax=Sulfuracidifex tepidarius TaxID=1294262 RepID=A0A510DZ59_9CREN|nr:hypothetical protein [Sulfuracidifex tepidarius]BBG22753.1 hypothetical protein IC006_0037 [Sulfuracidifex tepidarius]BBG25532.1 hypothetical protein IC007_0037 [Sulfuracidifex tepidarius]